MDIFNDVVDTVKTEKPCAVQRYYRRLKPLTTMFRFLELCVGLVFFLWIFARLPFVVKISGEFFRRIGELIASPVSIFLICNAIIVTLFVKSENLAANNADIEDELYQEFMKSSDSNTTTENRSSLSEKPAANPSPTPLTTSTILSETTTEDQIVTYQDKQIIVSETNALVTCEKDKDSESDSDLDLDSELDVYYQPKICCRKANLSEWGESEEMKVGPTKEEEEEEEELSAEEFNRAVDEFIRKQLRFRRQESLDGVLVQV